MSWTELAEVQFSACLQTILSSVGPLASIKEAEGFNDCMGRLERLLPYVLGDAYDEWARSYLGIDWITPRQAIKVGMLEAELIGECQLFEGEALIYMRLRIAEAADEIEQFDCKLGEYPEGTAEVSRIKSLRLRPEIDWLTRLDNFDVNAINWIYEVIIGEDGS